MSTQSGGRSLADILDELVAANLDFEAFAQKHERRVSELLNQVGELRETLKQRLDESLKETDDELERREA